VATVNSSWELTVGLSSKGKPTVTRALTVASRCPARHARKEVAQGSLCSLAAFPSRRGFEAGRVRFRIILLAARREPAPLEKPQGRTAGPALPGRTTMSARPFAVGGRLAVPSAYIAAEPRRVGQALPLLHGRVTQGGRLQAQRLQFERCLGLCDPEVATVNPSLQLTVDSSSKEMPTVATALSVATRYRPGMPGRATRDRSRKRGRII
jgi:hypothetical protein